MTSRAPRSVRLLAAAVLAGVLSGAHVAAQAIQYERPVQVAPQQETIGGGYVTPDVQRPRPREQQVAADQMRQAERGMRVEQLLDTPQGKVQAIGFNRLDHFGQRRLGRRGEGAQRQEQRHRGKAHELQFVTCSCRMRQRPPSDLPISSVFMALPLNRSER